ncbi:MAG TPA: sigma-70 family RNA polymerase sigma factor [Polyangiales bacterium]|nr:sigma-70 family RNA polymerase sigma factor [Polyangiales bacterium]
MKPEPFDPAAVIREHAAFVQRVLRHLGVASSQLDDASQEVFLVVCRQLDKFEGRSSLRTWLYGICRNVAAATRRGGHAREVLAAEPPEVDQPPGQDAALWLKQAHAQLMRALESLDEGQRMVFVLYEIEELSMEEIAAALAAPVTTCYSRLYAARERVQALLRRRARFRSAKPVEVLP